MKIVHLIDYFQPKVGYQEFFLAREHQKMGHEVTVITSDRYFSFPNYDETYLGVMGRRVIGKTVRVEEGVKVRRLSCAEIVPGSLVILLGLQKTLKEVRPDLVFCHNVFSITSFLAAFYKKNAGYKLIYDTHAARFNTDFSGNVTKRLYGFVYQKAAIPLIKNRADGFFAIGDEEQKFLSFQFNMDRMDIPIIRYGVSMKNGISFKNEITTVRKKLGMGYGGILVVYTGKVTPNKEINILVEAFKQFKSHNKIRLMIIGGGDKKYLDDLRKLAGTEVKLILLPFIENKELVRYYCASDFGVWPGDPSAGILEAMACGLPVILPYAAETEYLDNSGGIVRFKRGDVQDLTEKIEKLAKDKDYRGKTGKNARKFIKNELSWEKIAKMTLNLGKKLQNSQVY